MNPLVTVSAVTFVGLVSKWHLSRLSRKPPSIDEAKKEMPVPVAEPNWEWSTYDQFEDQFGRITLKKRTADNTDENVESGPFRVIHRRKTHQLWPDVVQIVLSSGPLIQIVQQYLPDDGDLKSVAEPSIDGRELFVMLDALKNHQHKSESHGKLENHSPPHGGGAHANHDITNGDGSLMNHELPNGDGSSHGLPNGNGGLQHHDHELANGDTPFKSGNKLTGGGGDGHASKDQELLHKGDSDAGKDAQEGELHLKHLVRFMEKQYSDIPVRVHRMRDEKRVAWDFLWAFLTRESKVVYKCDQSEELLCAVVSANYYHYNKYPPEGWWFLVELDVWDYDGRSYHKCKLRRQIRKYDGECAFASLAVCPIEIIGVPESVEAGFLANGKAFYDLAVKNSHRFMNYTGPLFQQKNCGSCWKLCKERADGRVMIDLASFSKMNPDYPMGNAQVPTSSRFFILQGGRGGIEFSASQESRNVSFAKDSEVSDESLIFAPAIVYGFSFALKQWGAFAIHGFNEISFDTSSFDELVMEPEVKGLVYNLVSQYIAPPGDGSLELERVDPISSKGEGCIFLCYGPPGTGKTLTAESIAENMQRPLWALSVSELGTTPNELEKTLFKVLDIAATWRAALLLDEADVYLEKRTVGADLNRNAMTGVFLRMLEYYRGVLFLTTNRIGTFDEAFRSRISMFLNYPKLSLQHKEQVWRTLLQRARVKGLTANFVSELAAQDLNGREIRNTIHTALVWAKSNGEAATAHHVRYVMGILASSLESLNAVLQGPAQSSAT